MALPKLRKRSKKAQQARGPGFAEGGLWEKGKRMKKEGRKRSGKGRAVTTKKFIEQMQAFDTWEAKKNHWEHRRRQLGTFGAASEVRHIDPKLLED